MAESSSEQKLIFALDQYEKRTKDVKNETVRCNIALIISAWLGGNADFEVIRSAVRTPAKDLPRAD
jgi:acyl carrier protein phosphodiesterase